MKLVPSNSKCIWCGETLLPKNSIWDCGHSGPRPRSDEHVIPRALFGNLVTTDLCKCCNEHFGFVCDYALLEDQRIVEAAQLAGIPITKLWKKFSGIQFSAAGHPVKTFYSDGLFKPQPDLKNLDKLAISTTDGVIHQEHLKNLQRQLIKKIRNKELKLTESQISQEVEKLLAAVQQNPAVVHYNEIIGEGFAPTPLNSKVTVTRETQPWKTQWCIAKIFFELSCLLWTEDYRIYAAPVIEALRSFLTTRQCSEDEKQGVGIFEYSRLSSDRAQRKHIVEGVITPTQVVWSVSFFGTASWKYEVSLKPIRAPKHPGYLIKVANCFDTAQQTKVEVKDFEK